MLHAKEEFELKGRIVLTALIMVIGVSVRAQVQPWPVRYRQDLTRVSGIEWRLREAAGDRCPFVGADIGAVFDDRRAYPKKDWPLLEKTLAMGSKPVVASVVPTGPAARAGIRQGDEIEEIDGVSVEDIAMKRGARDLVAEALIEEITEKPPGKQFPIRFTRDSAEVVINIVPVRHCGSRIVLVSDRKIDAHSDARNIAISTGLVAFARNDAEVAFAAAHELAHIIYRDRRGGRIAVRRQMEDAADLTGLRIVRCAGFDGERAIALLDHLAARDWLGFLRAPTHRSFRERAANLRKDLLGPHC